MKVRKNRHDFAAGIPKYWSGPSKLQSHILNTYSLMFPPGEAFFIRSVKHFADQIEDAKLKEDLRAFIGQEMQHSMAHDRFNAELQKTNADMSWYMAVYTRPTFEMLEPWARQFPLLNRLALSMTAACENMTAGFAEMLFSGDTMAQILREDIRDLYAWHAAEEMEHRDIAFDLLSRVSGSYAMRMAGMVSAYGFIIAYVTLGTAYFTLKDREYNLAELPGELWNLFTRKNALGRVFIEGIIEYMRPDFHPSDVPFNEAALEYLEKRAS